MKSEQINSYTEVKQQTNRDVRQLGVMVSDTYEADSTDGQTVINLTFAIDVNYKKQIQVFVDGLLLTEGIASNYTFTNVQAGVSNQITLTSPLMAGLPIKVLKLGAYQEQFPNPSSVTASINTINTTLSTNVGSPNDMAKAGFQSFVAKTLITAPNTQIQNRAQVEAASLKAIAGVERVVCRSLVLSRTEFGPNGEQVWELDSKDSRVRFVGDGWFSAHDTNGGRPFTNTGNDFVEITFYGTGLNLLCAITNASQDFKATIDGGAEGANLVPASFSIILSGRNYGQNTLIAVASGLSLGWHTVKIRRGAVGFSPSGFEILNQRTDLAVLAGTAYGGMKQEVLSSLSASAFNAGVVGTRGARVVKYLKDGVISQVVQEVNGASAFLTSADHTNEEVVRKINYREFGANRADDFSTLTTGRPSSFTLDDGTTTLTSNNAAVSNDALRLNPNGSFVTITFVGTGLDIIARDDGSGTSATDTFDALVDGVSIGNYSPVGTTNIRTIKICSGLPYGTHTVKFIRTNAPVGWNSQFSDFIIYQPKKPSLPTGAIEVTDYNVLANRAIGASGAISQGTLRKMSQREFTYSGAWSYQPVDADFANGFNLRLQAAGYQEFSFFGTGVEYTTAFGGLEVINQVVSIDGSSNLSSFTTQLVYGTPGAIGSLIFTPATGTFSGTTGASTGYRTKLAITGLALGWHKIRVTWGSGSMYADAFDVITPIHTNPSSLKVGSLSMLDKRAFSPVVDKPEVIDLGKAKAWCVWDATNSKVLASYNISQVLNATTNSIFYFAKPFKTSNYASSWSSSTAATGNFLWESTVQTPSKSVFSYYNNSGTLIAPNSVCCVTFFGELEDEGEI